MVRRVVIKFGGALITKKDEECVAHLEIIQNLCAVMKSISDDGIQPILVHGAGSFGHLKAKRWRLNEGYISDMEHPEDVCSSQEEAVSEVRNDMLTLNSIIVNELEKVGFEVRTHPPHQWATNLGPTFSGSLDHFSDSDPSIVHVTFGDVVDVDDERMFGILSGDDLVARLSLELPGIEALIFAMGGVDGLLKVPPHSATDEDLIEHWSPDVNYEGLHQSDIDVTGGIGLKIMRGHLVAQSGIGVYLINGEHPSRILSLLRQEPWRGTTILP